MIRTIFRIFAGVAFAGISFFALAQSVDQSKRDFVDKFRQLDEVLPTPLSPARS